jgi:peptidoglycan hydrolase-like protein with peptidoglycan-binding domain
VGAEGPNSFDCSGLVQTAYRTAGINLPRASRQQYGAGQLVPLSALRPGDLLFYARRPGLLARATRPAPGRGMLPVQLGERSRAVATVQQRLAANRICVAVDGDFGPLTRRAVVAFQRAHGLATDGVVGPRTWGALVTFGRQRSPARR